MSLLPLPDSVGEHAARCEVCRRLLRAKKSQLLGRGRTCDDRLNPKPRRVRAWRPAPNREVQPGPTLFDLINEESEDECDGDDRPADVP